MGVITCAWPRERLAQRLGHNRATGTLPSLVAATINRMSNTLSITALEQRQLEVITRRLEQVEPVVRAIHEAAEHVPAADRVAMLLEQVTRAQRGTWNVAQP
jgi:hypothetical protein